MWTNDIEILAAIDEGKMDSFEERYAPNEEYVSEATFRGLCRSGMVHTDVDTSASDRWGYIGVSLTSSGKRRLNELRLTDKASHNQSNIVERILGFGPLFKNLWLSVVSPVVVALILYFILGG